LTTSTTNSKNNSFTEVKIFPNPSKEQFNVYAEISEVQDVQLEIFNVNGRLVDTKILEKVLEIQTQISLENFPNGLYFLFLRLEDGTAYATKLVKIKK